MLVAGKVYQQEIWHPNAGVVAGDSRRQESTARMSLDATFFHLPMWWSYWSSLSHEMSLLFAFFLEYCPEVERQFFGWFSLLVYMQIWQFFLVGFTWVWCFSICPTPFLPRNVRGPRTATCQSFLGVPSGNNMTSWVGFVDFFSVVVDLFLLQTP